jgi:hypothetical protein
VPASAIGSKLEGMAGDRSVVEPAAFASEVANALCSWLSLIDDSSLAGSSPPYSWAEGLGVSPEDEELLHRAGLANPFAAGTAGWSWLRVLDWLKACSPSRVWLQRYTLAVALSTVSAAPSFVATSLVRASSLEDGRKVHQEIGHRFLDGYGPVSLRGHNLMIERTVHLTGLTLPLRDARLLSPRLRRLWLAFLSPRHSL